MSTSQENVKTQITADEKRIKKVTALLNTAEEVLIKLPSNFLANLHNDLKAIPRKKLDELCQGDQAKIDKLSWLEDVALEKAFNPEKKNPETSSSAEEAERLEAEQRAAREAREAEERAAQAEDERLEAARLLAAQLEAERLEAARLAAEQEAARVEAARVEAARLAAERVTIEARLMNVDRLNAAEKTVLFSDLANAVVNGKRLDLLKRAEATLSEPDKLQAAKAHEKAQGW